MIYKHTVILIAALILLSSCDGGLKPPEEKEKSFLEVTINYIGGASEWPDKDSVIAVRLAAFKTYPTSDIINEFAAKNVYFTFLSLPLFVDSSFVSLEITSPPVELKYIVIVQQYDSLLTSQKAIGVYTTSGDQSDPSAILVEPGKSYPIKINVDFNNPPPQPF